MSQSRAHELHLPVRHCACRSYSQSGHVKSLWSPYTVTARSHWWHITACRAEPHTVSSGHTLSAGHTCRGHSTATDCAGSVSEGHTEQGLHMEPAGHVPPLKVAPAEGKCRSLRSRPRTWCLPAVWVQGTLPCHW